MALQSMNFEDMLNKLNVGSLSYVGSQNCKTILLRMNHSENLTAKDLWLQIGNTAVCKVKIRAVPVLLTEHEGVLGSAGTAPRIL